MGKAGLPDCLAPGRDPAPIPPASVLASLGRERQQPSHFHALQHP